MNTVASRCSAKITRPRRICDQKLPDGGPPSAGLTTPGLRSAVSLTVPSRPVPRSSYPQAAGTSAGCGPATRCLHVLPSMILLDHYRAAAWPAQAIGPDREISFCAVDEPSNLDVVFWYGPTLSLVTKVRPVLVSAGCTRPPERLNMNRAMTGRNPCRYGCWSMVKSRKPPLIDDSVCGVRSNPPDATLPCRLYFLMIAPTVWVEPASTAKMPWRLDLCAST